MPLVCGSFALFLHLYLLVYVCVYIHMYLHMCIYIYTHVHICSSTATLASCAKPLYCDSNKPSDVESWGPCSTSEAPCCRYSTIARVDPPYSLTATYTTRDCCCYYRALLRPIARGINPKYMSHGVNFWQPPHPHS